MQHLFGANFPQGGLSAANLAGCHRRLVKLAVTPVRPVDLVRRQLQLLVQHQPRAQQDAIFQLGIDVGLIGGQDFAIRAGDQDRPLDQ